MLDYLSRDDAPFDEGLWQQIDAAVTDTARKTLVGRRFLPLYGPIGGGASIARIDNTGKEEVFEDGFSVMEGRSLSQIPQVYEDFWLYWRDITYSEQDGVPIDLSAARGAAQTLCYREDGMIFYGVEKLGIQGLLTAKGVNTQKRGDWNTDEGAFSDIAQALATLRAAGRFGSYSVVVSLDLYVQLQRITPGTGVLASERISNLVNGRLYASSVLKAKTAAVICAQPQYMDLLVGQDIRTAFTEAVDLNYHLRVLETALVRVKEPNAVVVLQ